MVTKTEVLKHLVDNSAKYPEIDVLFTNSITEKDLTAITSYLSECEVDENYNEITPDKISNIDAFMKVFNDKKDNYFVQLFIDFHNKMNFKSLQQYLTFRTKLAIFDYRIRAFLTSINSELKSDKPSFSAF